jgi:hypothetical protein
MKTTVDIKEMSQIERLQTMEQLWDAICHADQEPASPAWHRDILDERRKMIENGEAKLISLATLKQRLAR